MALRSEIAPITAGNSAPPIMLITRNDDPVLVSGPRPLIELAKMVGNMIDMKKLVAARRRGPPGRRPERRRASWATLIAANRPISRAGLKRLIAAVPRKRPAMKPTSDQDR